MSNSDETDQKDYVDQDAEPTMNAPEEGRPDGLEALKGDHSGDDDTDVQKPQHSDAELLEAQEQEGPSDE
jgi:hypothetical protein